MTERAPREYAETLRVRYRGANKRERGRILDEYCRTTGCHRKAAIRRLRRAPSSAARAPGRPRRYGPELLPILERVWAAGDHLCGTIVYDLAHGGVVWAGRDRTADTMQRFLTWLGPRRARAVHTVCCDMWAVYIVTPFAAASPRPRSSSIAFT